METCSYSPILIHWVTLSTLLFTMLFLIYHRELPGSMLQLWYFTTYMYCNLFNQSSTYGHLGCFFSSLQNKFAMRTPLSMSFYSHVGFIRGYILAYQLWIQQFVLGHVGRGVSKSFDILKHQCESMKLCRQTWPESF